MKVNSSIVTSADVLRVIEDARDAELCRDLDLFREILSSFWTDLEQDPQVSAYELDAQGELLRLCGVFLSRYGHARGFPEYQKRAKNILARAAELFERIDFREKAAETRIGLANCFWFSGQTDEYDEILRFVEEEFGTDPDHPVSIQIKLNRVFAAIWRHDCDEALSIVNEITGAISLNHDFRLRTQFHNTAGTACRMAGIPDQSVLHAAEAVRIARDADNDMFAAFNLNNLAHAHRIAGHFDKAQRTIDEAISIMESREDTRWMPHALDTKALIYIDEAEYDKALTVIGRAVEIFSRGEDYSGLTDAMWTNCLCLLRLDRVREAVVLFADLTERAGRQIGQVGVDKFAGLFAKEVHALKHFPLPDEVAAFKRSRVVRAMRESNGHVANAARTLGLRSQQHLSDILNNQFPDIYDELEIKRRVRRSKPAGPKRAAASTAPEITRLLLPKDRRHSFNFPLPGQEGPQYFHFPKNLMREQFGLKTDAVVAVLPAHPESLYEGAPVLYVQDDAFRLGRLSFDEFSGLFLVDIDKFTFLSDVQVLGVPVGHCPASEQTRRILTFQPLGAVPQE